MEKIYGTIKNVYVSGLGWVKYDLKRLSYKELKNIEQYEVEYFQDGKRGTEDFSQERYTTVFNSLKQYEVKIVTTESRHGKRDLKNIVKSFDILGVKSIKELKEYFNNLLKDNQELICLKV